LAANECTHVAMEATGRLLVEQCHGLILSSAAMLPATMRRFAGRVGNHAPGDQTI
jgi:hypothetical protein